MNDLRFGARMLARNPGSTLAMAVLIALGIGAGTVIFSVVDAVLLRPLPVHNPEELVRMVQRIPRIGTRGEFPFDYYEALRDHSTTLQSVFAETPSSFHFAMTHPEPAEQITARAVTPEYFDALGVKALYGRVLGAGDANEDSGMPPAVLSYGFWRRRFGGDPQVMGRRITLHGHNFVVVGVTPREFNGLRADTAPDVRVPNRAYPLLTGYPGVHRTIELAGRLKPGFTRAQAEAECQSTFQSAVVPYYRDILRESPENGAGELIKRGMALDPLARGPSILRERFADTLKLLMAFVAVLLLMVSSNVAGLLLARTAARREEIAVRLAMGATRARMIRQMLVESSLLAVLGTLGGLWIAVLAIPLAARAWPPIRDLGTTLLPLTLDVRMNARAFLFAMALSTLTVLLFSAAPAFAASRSSLDSVLRGARSSGGWRGRQALIVLQIALCTFLLAGASLFVRTFHQLHDMDPGFDRDHVATFTGDLTLSGNRTSLPRLLAERVQQIPGVVSAAISSRGVMRGRALGATVAPAGQSASPGDYLNSSLNEVSPGYFDTMGMRILAGRALAGSDASSDKSAPPKKVVVNQAFARRFFPNVNPVGQRFGVGVKPVEAADDEIVGVVSDAKYRSLREPIVPTFYTVATEYYAFVLNVRTRFRPESIFQPVQKALASIDPSAAFLEIHTLAEEVDDSTAAERVTAVLVSVLGAIAMLLAGVGIYGLLAYAIVRRRREIGIRMALGAEPAHIARLVGRETLVMAVGGIVFGLASALAAGPWIRSLLYGISPWDPKSLFAAAIFVAIVALGATAVPVIRATHMEPSLALRQES